MSDTIYTETMGTSCYVAGERCTTTAMHRQHGANVGVFAKSDERPVMFYVQLGGLAGSRGESRFVESFRQISRDEFDALVDMPLIRHSLGWTL